jgi:hypothetical protein
MADRVELLMEKMVDELAFYQKEGYFNKREIKEIVRKRRNFEYQL